MSSKITALAGQMKAAVDQVGAENAMRLKIAELKKVLVEKGVIGETYLTDASLFGQALACNTK